MVETIVTFITKSPYGAEDAFAGLRLALSQIASGVMEKSDVLLLEDGVYNAVKTQESEAVAMPSNLSAIQDLVDFDVSVFCVKEDIEERHIPMEKITDMVKLISRKEIPSLIQEYEVNTTF